MKQIKKGDIVRAHLDGTFHGRVVEVVSSRPKEWTTAGPMDLEIFCYVELKDGSVVKRKVTDLYVDYS